VWKEELETTSERTVTHSNISRLPVQRGANYSSPHFNRPGSMLYCARNLQGLEIINCAFGDLLIEKAVSIDAILRVWSI